MFEPIANDYGSVYEGTPDGNPENEREFEIEVSVGHLRPVGQFIERLAYVIECPSCKFYSVEYVSKSMEIDIFGEPIESELTQNDYQEIVTYILDKLAQNWFDAASRN